METYYLIVACIGWGLFGAYFRANQKNKKKLKALEEFTESLLDQNPGLRLKRRPKAERKYVRYSA